MHHTCNRRQLLKGAAGVAGYAMLSQFKLFDRMNAEAARQPLVIPIRRREIPNAQIAFVKTDNHAEGVVKALELFGINPTQGKQVVVKPNFNTSDAYPGSTHPEALSALVGWLQDKGADQITVGDRSYEGARSVMNALGVYDMAEEMGFAAESFNDLVVLPENWYPVQPEGSHWEYGFAVARPIMEAESVVSTCCLKTHGFGGRFTMSLKNSVGVLPKFGYIGEQFVGFMDDLHASDDMRKMIAEINVAYTPDLVVVDGIEAFIDGGPMEGTLADTQVVLVGTDRVALDAVGVALLRKAGSTWFDGNRIFEEEQIARAVELGLGVDSPEKIELLTDDPDSAAYADEIKDYLFEYG